MKRLRGRLEALLLLQVLVLMCWWVGSSSACVAGADPVQPSSEDMAPQNRVLFPVDGNHSLTVFYDEDLHCREDRPKGKLQATEADVVQKLKDSETFRRFLSNVEQPLSQIDLSHYYYYAIGVLYSKDANFTEFVSRVQAGAAAGHSRLHWILGVLYANGLGVPRSEAKSLLHITFAALQGIPEAHLAIAYRHIFGLGVNQSCEQALPHLREAADAVSMTYDSTLTPSHVFHTERFSAVGLEQIQEGAKQRKLTLDSLRYRADNGSPEAMVQLGYTYLIGKDGAPRSWGRARAYFEQAAREGYPRAYGALGQLHVLGDRRSLHPPSQDLEKAAHYFELGARHEEPSSLNGIGYLHAIGFLPRDRKAPGAGGGEGKGFAAPDYETAARYFNRSRLQGSVEGAYNLGVLYHHGRGVPADSKHAAKLFQVAAAHGSVLALWQIGQQRQAEGDCWGAVESFRMLVEHGSWADPSLQGSMMSFWISMDSDANADSGLASDASARFSFSSAASSFGVFFSSLLPSSWRGRRLGSSKPARGDVGEGQAREAANQTEGNASEVPALRDTKAATRRRRVEALEAISRIRQILDGRDPTPVLVRFLEALLLAEMGHSAHAFTAATLLDEELGVVDEELRDADLVAAGVVEAGNPSFARGNQISRAITTSAGPSILTLFWEFPALIRDRDDAAATPGITPWLLSQKEAKALLLLRLLRMCGEHHSKARLRMGNFYYYGESALLGVNDGEAFHHYYAAADRESAQAMFNLGFMYQVGLAGKHGRGAAAAAFADHFFEMPWCEAVGEGARALLAWRPIPDPRSPGDSLPPTPPFPLSGSVAAYDIAESNRARSRGVPKATFWRVFRADPELYDAVDLNLAKQCYEKTLAINPQVYFAVKIALFSVNLQWWWMYFSLVPGGLLREWGISMPFYRPPPNMSGREVCYVSSLGLRRCIIDRESTWIQVSLQDGFLVTFLWLRSQLWGIIWAVWPWIESLETFVGYTATVLLFVFLVLRHHAT
ncbi:unnamed protein product [Phytomonas sp. EM1]|nr:unnamed protein product [Phytomonas sp. EM1]|eukprot:CCW65507.1 unnamed protein product [Phytomonas sp. isolate EM1]